MKGQELKQQIKQEIKQQLKQELQQVPKSGTTFYVLLIAILIMGGIYMLNNQTKRNNQLKTELDKLTKKMETQKTSYEQELFELKTQLSLDFDKITKQIQDQSLKNEKEFLKMNKIDEKIYPFFQKWQVQEKQQKIKDELQNQQETKDELEKQKENEELAKEMEIQKTFYEQGLFELQKQLSQDLNKITKQIQDQSLKNEKEFLKMNQIEDKVYQLFEKWQEQEKQQKIKDELEKQKIKDELGKQMKREEEIFKMLDGKNGDGITRQIHIMNKKVVFRRASQKWGYANCYGTLGYLNSLQVTKLQITFKNNQMMAVGIARDELDLQRFNLDKILKVKDNSNYPFYGILTRFQDTDVQCNQYINIYNITGEMQDNESYIWTFDPINNQIHIEGQRLKQKVTKSIKPGKYYFVVFIPAPEQEISVQIL